MQKTIKRIAPFSHTCTVPGDKSISHRAVLLASLAHGTSSFRGLSAGADVRSSEACMSALGVNFTTKSGARIITSPGAKSLVQPMSPLDCGNSGTTMRLMAGILSGSDVQAVLTGDASLSRRPMQRVVDPMSAMGADISAVAGLPPLSIRGTRLTGIIWRPQIASAQVKSAILLAGLSAQGRTVVEEAAPTRDHTERLLQTMGAEVKFGPGWADVRGGQSLQPRDLLIPGDASSAAYFLVLAAMTPGAVLRVDNIGLNVGRIGFLEVLEAMGADVTITVAEDTWERVGSVVVKGKELRGFEIAGDLVPRTIDEIPVLAVAACVARGRSVVRDAAELRAKESDRITQLLRELSKMGAHCEELPDGLIIDGGLLQGAVVDAHGDHRLAMALAVAGSAAWGDTTLVGAECVDISYPEFWQDFAAVRGGQYA